MYYPPKHITNRKDLFKDETNLYEQLQLLFFKQFKRNFLILCNMMQPLSIIIVEKSGELKTMTVKDYKEEELFKKCGFKKADDFIKQVEWVVKYPSGASGIKYHVQVFAKTEGRANAENKYDFPPPIDKKLFFGSCAIIAHLKNANGTNKYVDLSLSLWEKLYEKLFGGFEDLALTAAEDDAEEDELDKIPKEKKTKHGYLKDGFVVDSSDAEDEQYETASSDDEDTEDIGSKEEADVEEETTVLEDIGSELSEEDYD